MTEPKPTPRMDILDNILSVLTEEQALMFSQRLKLCHERAVERAFPQEISVYFSERGLPRGFHVTDDVMPPKPRNQEI